MAGALGGIIVALAATRAFCAPDSSCTVAARLRTELSISADSAEALAATTQLHDTTCAGAAATAGRIAYDAGAYGAAVRLMREAVAADSDSTDMWDDLGLAFLRSGMADSAGKSFRHAVRLAPREPLYYNHLGLALMQQHNDLDATANYLAALGIDPSYVEARYNLGQLYESQGRHVIAEQQFRRAIRDGPKFIRARYALAVLLRRDKRYDEARAQLDTAIAIDSTFEAGYVERGFVALHESEYGRAETDFGRAVDLNAKNARARYGLGLTYAFEHRWVDAQHQCDSLRTLDGALADRLQQVINQ